MVAEPGIAIVILAAGASERMGSPKQLLSWGETTLMGHCISQCLAADATEVIVVLGARYEQIIKEADLFPVSILRHVEWADGIGSSIAFAARHLLEHSTAYDGILITLADQPLFDSEYYNSMIGRFETGSQNIVATSYGEKAGVPALFDAFYVKELARLKGDTGAKNLLLKHRESVTTVEAGDRTVDIDTPRAYQRQHRRFFGE